MKFAVLVFLCLPTICLAIDNPDSTDLLSDFETQAKSFEMKISELAGGSSAELMALGGKYKTFLDLELNKTYASLMKKLNEKDAKKLNTSQKRWLRFRDTEFDFINENWNRAKFGSSFVLSRIQFQTTLVKARVVQLLTYLR